jgi:hypothetical protein
LWLKSPAVGEQFLAVPADECLERRLVPFACEGDQSAVGLRLEDAK